MVQNWLVVDDLGMTIADIQTLEEAAVENYSVVVVKVIADRWAAGHKFAQPGDLCFEED